MKKLLLLSLLAPLMASAQPARPIWPPFTGVLPTSVLPGILPGLSVGNGQGVVTNIASTNWWICTNLSYSTITTNYTPPPWARWMYVECQGSGGGGGGGGCYPDSTGSSGGGAGSGGGLSTDTVYLDDLTFRTNLVVVVGARGQGGAPQITNNSSGLNGLSGGISYVTLTNWAAGLLLSGVGGAAGIGGTKTVGATGTGNRTASQFFGGSGGAGDDLSGANGIGAGNGAATSGGGGGGGVSSANVPAAGGMSGSYQFYGAYSVIGNLGGVAPGGNGGSEAALWRIVPGRGGGGGAGGTNVIGGTGGSGWFGGGGGGGGGGRDGYYGGPGGDGGGGYVRIGVWQ